MYNYKQIILEIIIENITLFNSISLIVIIFFKWVPLVWSDLKKLDTKDDQFMSYRFHEFKEKLEIVQKIQAGVSLRKLSYEYNILMRIIIEWNRRYKLYGEEGLVKKSRNMNYSLKQKKEIVDIVLVRRVSLPQNMRRIIKKLQQECPTNSKQTIKQPNSFSPVI